MWLSSDCDDRDSTSVPAASLTGSPGSAHNRMMAQDSPIDPRVLFSAERTFLSWLRTGLSLMGFGFVVARFGLFLREMSLLQGQAMPTGFSRWFGIALIGLGVALTAGAVAQHVATLKRLNRGLPLDGKPTALGLAIGALLIVIGASMTFYLAFFA